MSAEHKPRPLSKLPCEVFMEMAKAEIKQLRAKVSQLESDVWLQKQNTIHAESNRNELEQCIRNKDGQINQMKQLIESYKNNFLETDIFKNMKRSLDKAERELKSLRANHEALIVQFVQLKEGK